MALLDKLFSTKRKLDNGNRESRDRARSSQIYPEQVRLLLFKECDWRGRKLLFDSSTIEKVPATKNDKPNIKETNEVPCIVEVFNGFTYMYKGPAADANALGEMIFGAVAMNYKSLSFKIHIMDEPKRLMCSKVFCVPTSRRISRVDRKANETSGNLHNSSKPLNVPLHREEGVSLSFSIGRGDSGYYGDQSPHSSVSSTYDYFSMFDIWDDNTQDEFMSYSPPGRKLSTSSNGSWQRRTFQNIATRFDLGNQSSNLLSVPTSASNVTSCDSQIYSNSSTSGTSDSLNSIGSCMVQKKSKLGLALLITVTDSSDIDLVRKCVEHSPQLQTLVCRLRLATLEAGAGASAGGFVATLHQAAGDAANWLSDVMYGPRLQPVWLNLVTSENQRGANEMAESLLSDLCSVLSVGDTKSTNFFISTLLTHVLTYHLGWVTTVSPYDAPDPEKHSLKKNTDHKRPYNALWAQLSDLCGSIGFPPRAARTIISGTSNTPFINRLLVVLTYFVRCGDIRRNDFQFSYCVPEESKVISVNQDESADLRRTVSHAGKLGEVDSQNSLRVPSLNTQGSYSSVSTLAPSEVSIKKSATLANLSQTLSTSMELDLENSNSVMGKPMTSQLKRTPTIILPVKSSSDSSLTSSISEESEADHKVVFVLGDDEKLVGLKNKSNGGKSVKKSSKGNLETFEVQDMTKGVQAKDNCDQEKCSKSSESPSKCCGQTLQHSKPIKHSGFKFEFDKYPQIVTNYMKSKNLEILDRHYIGKPGNLKLDNFQFDPTIVPPIQEERCETCYKCQLMESTLQTPTNASELEYMNDVPRQSEPQYAKESVVKDTDTIPQISPKTFVRKRKENTLVVNLCSKDVGKPKIAVEEIKLETSKHEVGKLDVGKPDVSNLEVEKSEVSKLEVNKLEVKNPEVSNLEVRTICKDKEKDKLVKVKEVLEFPLPRVRLKPQSSQVRSGFNVSLLGGVTDHYVPDLILQGTVAKTSTWEAQLRRDLDLATYLNKSLDSPIQAVAIIGDTNSWQVRVVGVGRECGEAGCAGGMSALVAAMLDALPAMRRARVPARQCLFFLESKLREFCVLSKTLADMLMSTDFCDISTLTKSLNIDMNDVPLLLAVATTHTPQVATRYGISYR